MKLTLEVADDKAAFFLELIANLPFVKTPRKRAKATGQRKIGQQPGQDTTDYLLSSPANRERLLASIADVRAGRVEYHDLIDE